MQRQTRVHDTASHRAHVDQLINNQEALQLQSLEALRLRVYATVFPIGFVAMTVIWLLDLARGVDPAALSIVQPLLALIFLGFAIVIIRRPELLRPIEAVTFVIVCVFFVVQLYAVLYENLVSGRDRAISDFPQWLPIVYLLAFLIFSRRKALIASLVFFGAIMLPGLLFLALHGADSFRMTAFNTLAQIYFSHAIYIPLFSGIALLKEHYELATRLAAAMASVAAVDSLTGIANRRAVEQVLRQSLEQSRRYQRPLALIMFDIDFFKQVNDTFGHKMGDTVLIRVARAARTNLRAGDTIGRWGGEEFLIVCPDTTATQAVLLADRLRQVIEREHFIGSHIVTVSLGISAMQPDDLAETIVHRADEALYRAKQRGRNRVEIEAPIS